jgi:hypothetical protein
MDVMVKIAAWLAARWMSTGAVNAAPITKTNPSTLILSAAPKVIRATRFDSLSLYSGIWNMRLVNFFIDQLSIASNDGLLNVYFVMGELTVSKRFYFPRRSWRGSCM